MHDTCKQKIKKHWVLAWMFTLVPSPFFLVGGGGGWRWEGQLDWEMRCFNTPLPLSFCPTPPHTWDGHFISEYSKWKGDLNLPCLLVPPFLSPSPTHSFCCWWTEHCWLPIADTRVSYSEKHIFLLCYCFVSLVYFFSDWQHLEKSLDKVAQSPPPAYCAVQFH